jgi:hypothetical protein
MLQRIPTTVYLALLAAACAPASAPPSATGANAAKPQPQLAAQSPAPVERAEVPDSHCLEPRSKEGTDKTTKTLGWKPPEPGECRPDVPAVCAELCQNGQGYACFMLASSYRYGVGVARDVPCGVAMAKRGCELGDGGSCSLLGAAYQTGQGVEKDLRRAEQLQSPACDAGVPSACIGIAEVWLERGDRIADAIDLLTTTCQRPQGYHAACHRLGTLYRDGSAVQADPARARELFLRGCKGFKPSCRALKALDGGDPAAGN